MSGRLFQMRLETATEADNTVILHISDAILVCYRCRRKTLESNDSRHRGQVLTSIMFLSLRHMAIFLLVMTAGADIALAQSPACDRWRTELASMRGGGGGQRSAAAAQQAGAELSRAINYSRQIGCDRSQFFGGGAPQCGALNARISQLQAQFSQLQGQAQSAGSAERRAQLAGLIEANCQTRGVYQTPPPLPVGAAPQQQPRRERTFFEALFGIEPQRGPVPDQIESTLPELDPNQQPEEKGIRFGAGMPVCVRTCDGFFFPLSNSPGGRENQAEMCAALCPSAEMQVFYMSGNGDIESSVGRGGQAYASLPNAGKYIRSYDPTCGCRKQGESWTAALRDAESMLDRQRGDVIVTQAKSDELSKPRGVATPRKSRNAPQTPVVAPEPAPTTANIPTAGTESSGIGSQDTVGSDTLGQGLGLRRDVTGANGEKKSIRIVAPNLAPQRQIQ